MKTEERMSEKRLKVTLKKSGIGKDKYFSQVLKGMGLGKLNSTCELVDTPASRGMINKVRHMIEVEGE